jgi:16S rRNA (cytidine1402-2'-O)-methyltransferase
MTRGEAVLVVAGAPEADAEAGEDTPRIDRLLVPLLVALPLSQAVDLVADTTGLRRNRIYDRALALRAGAGDA